MRGTDSHLVWKKGNSRGGKKFTHGVLTRYLLKEDFLFQGGGGLNPLGKGVGVNKK